MSTRTHCDVCNAVINKYRPNLVQLNSRWFGFDRELFYELCHDCAAAMMKPLEARKKETDTHE